MPFRRLKSSQAVFRAALADSFNTPEAMQVLLALVTEANKAFKRPRKERPLRALLAVSNWIAEMLRMFGLATGVPMWRDTIRVIGWNDTEGEALVMVHLLAWSSFRDAVRAAARKGDDAGAIAALAEGIRQRMADDFGVVLSTAGPSLAEPTSTLRPSEVSLVRRLGRDPQVRLLRREVERCADTGAQRESLLLPLVRVWGDFLEAVLAEQSSPKKLLALCDKLRDEDLVELGVALDDQDGACCFTRRWRLC